MTDETHEGVRVFVVPGRRREPMEQAAGLFHVATSALLASLFSQASEAQQSLERETRRISPIITKRRHQR